MMVQSSRSLIKAACVPRVRKVELLEIEMMAELVAEGAQERSEGCDLLPHCRPHPDPDHHGFGSVVPEKLGAPTFWTRNGRAASTRMPLFGTS